MTNLHATIRHHSIASARVVDLGTDNLTKAKKAAVAEFGDDFADCVICILGDRDIHNPSGIVATRRVNGRYWRPASWT